ATKKNSTGNSAYIAAAAVDVGDQLFQPGIILLVDGRWQWCGAHVDFPWYFFRVYPAGNERLPDCTARLAAAGRQILLNKRKGVLKRTLFLCTYALRLVTILQQAFFLEIFLGTRV